MNKIPEDILKTAMAVTDAMRDWVHLDISLDYPGIEYDTGNIALIVARALMAERERCAKIARAFPMEAWATHVDIAMREAYKVGVAEAIRNAVGKKPAARAAAWDAWAAENMTPERRAEIAKKAAESRWEKKTG